MTPLYKLYMRLKTKLVKSPVGTRSGIEESVATTSSDWDKQSISGMGRRLGSRYE